MAHGHHASRPNRDRAEPHHPSRHPPLPLPPNAALGVERTGMPLSSLSSKEFDVPLSMLYKPQNVAPADINASVGEDEKQTYMDDGDKVVVDDVDPDDEETSKE